MPATVTQRSSGARRRRKPIIGRPIKWSAMTDEQRAQACETIRNEDWFLEDIPHTDDMESTFRWILDSKFGFAEDATSDWKFYWSLGGCQGDGVAFDGQFVIDAGDPLVMRDDFLLRLFGKSMLGIEQLPEYRVKIKQDGRYCHWNSMDVTVEYDWDGVECSACGGHGRMPVKHLLPALGHYDSDRTETCRSCNGNGTIGEPAYVAAIAQELEEHVSELVKDMSRACEKAGYAEIDYTRTDEYVGDMISANDYEFVFDEDGGYERS